MPIAWFLCPYKRRQSADMPTRYCAMDDFTASIFADGGNWSEAEILGGEAIVKVRASDPTLTAINAAPGFLRIPAARLDDPLSSLTGAQKSAILSKAQALGYSLAEIQSRFPNNLGTYTLGDVLRFLASRRLKPRYDVNLDEIVCDGPPQPGHPVEGVDAAVAG